VRASGKSVRGQEEPGPDPQELMRDTDIDDGTFDDESVSSYSEGGFQDQACLVSCVLVMAGLSGLCRSWFLLKGDHGRPLFLPRPFPAPGTFQFR
jgi:hypothetical protein